MMQLRAARERGYADHGWLQSYHSFSFAEYYDPAHMGFGNLRVINEDWVAPGMGFGMHGHRDMEIITYVLEGALAHKDSMGHAQSVPPGEVQRMSAGSGVMHSEFNHAPASTTHLLQIWIEPARRGIAPSYEQRAVDPASKRGQLACIAAPQEGGGVVAIHADARLYAGCFEGAERAELALDPARKAYVHLARGALTVNGQRLQAGDALKLTGESLLQLQDGQDAEVLVFDLAT